MYETIDACIPARVHPYTFYKMARTLAKKNAAQEEWRALRDRMWSYVVFHIDSFYNLSLDHSRAVMRAWDKKPKQAWRLSNASIECAAWNMAWWCLTRLIYLEDKERRYFYLHALWYYLMVANTFAA